MTVRRPDGTRETLHARAVVLAAGGFESNPAAARRLPRPELGRGQGPRHAVQHRRGAAAPRSPLGAQPYGHWSGCHAIQWDRDAPPTGDLELTNRFSRQSYPVGIVVNADGERFVDEGADFRNYTYAKYGAEVLRQPLGVAHQVFDAQLAPAAARRSTTRRRARRACERRHAARSSPRALGIDPERFERTVRDFNAAIEPGEFDPAIKDGLRTRRPGGRRRPTGRCALDTPPYVAFPVTCGITFTFGGVRVDEDARVLDVAGRPIGGLFAAGELVGGLFFHNYPGGSGLTAGAVYGRRAGYSAARRTLVERVDVRLVLL